MEASTTSKKTFSIQKAIRFGWQQFKQQWRFLILTLLGTLLVVALLQVIASVLGGGIPRALFIAATWIIQVFIAVAWVTIYLVVARGEKASKSNLTENADIWWKYIIGGILYSLLVYIGTFLLIIPGIYFAIKYQFFFYILIDKKGIGIKESFKESGRMTKGVRWKLFGFWWVAFGCAILGLIALGIGVFVASLVIGIATAAIYVQLKQQMAIIPENSPE